MGEKATGQYGTERRRVDLGGGRFKRAIRLSTLKRGMSTYVVTTPKFSSSAQLKGYTREAKE